MWIACHDATYDLWLVHFFNYDNTFPCDRAAKRNGTAGTTARRPYARVGSAI